VNGKTITYVGRTSGRGSILFALFRRQRNHHTKGYGPLVIDRILIGMPGVPAKADPAYWAIRGREQQMIDFYGGAKSDNPHTSAGNPIRGVRKSHPLGRLYDAASTAAFGRIAPFTGNIPTH
jgi:hypothetical protein